MIETQINPAAALQTRDNKSRLPSSKPCWLHWSFVRPVPGRDFEDLLQGHTTEIDRMDQELIQVLSRRMNIVRRTVHTKRSTQSALPNPPWASIIEARLEKGDSAGLHREFLLRLLQIVHKDAIRIQCEELGQTDDSPGKDQ
jgi:chorismate mutase